MSIFKFCQVFEFLKIVIWLKSQSIIVFELPKIKESKKYWIVEMMTPKNPKYELSRKVEKKKVDKRLFLTLPRTPTRGVTWPSLLRNAWGKDLFLSNPKLLIWSRIRPSKAEQFTNSKSFKRIKRGLKCVLLKKRFFEKSACHCLFSL